ncbi:hypothetical protein [Paraburkholderia sp.]|jgi:hypothetical protein|uniref:hypothetical protein n=1 Tax=Paraburkholderia sp. TaxID=1926495 RepID=UPI002F3FC478
MVINHTFEISTAMIAVICLAAILAGALLVAMRLRRQYPPGLIGALIGAFFCFLLLEALPALT